MADLREPADSGRRDLVDEQLFEEIRLLMDVIAAAEGYHCHLTGSEIDALLRVAGTRDT